MKRTIIALVLCAVSGLAIAADDSQAAPAFRDLDTDKDGFVNKKEAMAWSDLTAVFEHVDMNQDGKLDKSEYAALQANEADK
jgi:Ca2+-binding EF-hand superfamily protein